MTLFSLAKKNIIGSIKNYLLYVISMILSVVIYYTFVSFQYSPEVQQSIEASTSVLNVFIGASVILIVFVAVFIGYSNKFFTNKRKKEIGLYALLGLRKKTIAQMLFYENLIMGVVAVLIGIALGTLLSKLFTMIWLKLLHSVVHVSFGVPIEAIVNTFVVFSILILFTSLMAYRMIYRFKLIELFQADKEGEKAPPKARIAAALLAVAMIVISYWIGFQPPVSSGQMLLNLLVFLVSIILGTYLLFRFLTIALIKFAQRRTSHYYRGINLISISQLLYRVNGNARTLAMIALLSAVTLSAISVGYSFYYTNELHAKREAPFTYMHMAGDEAWNNQIGDIIAADAAHPVIAQIDIPIIPLEGQLSNPMLQQYMRDGSVKLISDTVYNEALKQLDKEAGIQLAGNQAVGIQPLLTQYTSDDYIGHSVELSLPGGDEMLTFVSMAQDRVIPWSYPDFNVIVSEQLFNRIAEQVEPVVIKAYEVADELAAKRTTEQLHALSTDERPIISFYTVYRKGLETAGLNIFILGFLGLVFLAATGSMIYFKQLTDAHQDKGRFDILRKLGVSARERRAIIRKQALFIFGLPLIVGIVHSTVMLEICSNIFSVLIGVNITIPIMLSMAAYVVIYLGYYVLTVSSVNRILNQRAL